MSNGTATKPGPWAALTKAWRRRVRGALVLLMGCLTLTATFVSLVSRVTLADLFVVVIVVLDEKLKVLALCRRRMCHRRVQQPPARR